MIARRNLYFVLTAALLLGTAPASYGAGKGKPKADPELDGLVWKPFIMQPGEYFKYELIDYTLGKKSLKYWVSVQVKDISDGKLEVVWGGEDEAGKKNSVTTREETERHVEKSRPALDRIPGATPFTGAVLMMHWERVAGFKWNIGANWSVVFDEMVPMGFVLKVSDYCTVAGQKGFKSKMFAGKIAANESCVSPKIPLPLRVRVNDINSKPRFEARLLEYRPAPAAPAANPAKS